jgi:hypothetical protein
MFIFCVFSRYAGFSLVLSWCCFEIEKQWAIEWSKKQKVQGASFFAFAF